VSPEPEAAVEVRGLVKRYGGATAVAGATFCAASGEITAVLGPNGAGKTSTIEICEGLRHADGGTVRVLGRDPARDGAWLRARVGVMLQDGGLPAAARALDLLTLVASMYARPLSPAGLLEQLGLSNQARTPVRRLSGGERQRLALAIALTGGPEVVFLDEPTAGLDPQARQLVWQLITSLRDNGVAVVLTTHLLDEAERLADHVVLMAGGRVVTQGTPKELTGDSGHTLSFEATPGLDLGRLSAVLPASAGVTEPRPGRYVVRGSPGSGGLRPADIAAVTAWCADLDVMPEGLSLGRRSLEDVFMELAAS
jgi:ABC-2 type transport system ATP-binding protein